MVLGFAASEAGGRFAAHDAADIDADFADLEDVIEQMLQSRIAATAKH